MYPTKRRHNNHSSGGHTGGAARRPHQQGRHQQGQNQGGQRPRKNYAVLREKFMNQARDAMSSGDRVLAEYYLQHAEHYYRMQQEFLAERAARFQQHQAQNQQPVSEAEFAAEEDAAAESEGEEELGFTNVPNNSNVLPAFLTRQVPAPAQGEAKPAVSANWEEE